MLEWNGLKMFVGKTVLQNSYVNMAIKKQHKMLTQPNLLQ